MPISYDEHIKRPHEEHEYTIEEIYELQKCRNNYIYFLENYVYIMHPDRGKILFNLYDFQKEIIEKIQNNRFIVGLCARQMGKTQVVAGYLLTYSIFTTNKTSGVVSNKQSSAIEILDRIKIMYENLPGWIKPGIKNYSKTTITFDNGSRIIVSATSKNSFRSFTINGNIFADELAFVDKNKQNDFWASNFPTVTASRKAKIIVISTPNGMFDLFHTIYSGAENKKNGFVYIKADWRAHPDRDEQWAEEHKKALGSNQLWKQEQEIKFIGSVNTVINDEVLKFLFINYKEPLLYDLKDRLRIYEKPEKNYKYILGVDSAKGTGEHDSTIQVIKINSYNPVDFEQVAVFQDNKTDTYEFSTIVNRLSIYYNDGYILVENNGEGSTVAQNLHWIFENPNIYNSGNKKSEIGIRATKNTKPTCVINMKKVIDEGLLKIFDLPTIQQLGTFIEKKNNIFEGKDLLDDLVSGLYWSCYIFNTELLEEDVNLINTNKKEEKAWGILTDINDYDFEENFNWIIDW